MPGIKCHKTNGKTLRLLTALVMLILAVALPVLSPGQKQDQSDQASGQKMNVPQSPQEHRERAEQYRKKAAEYRQDAEAHREMLAGYSKGVAKNPKDTGENSYIKKMRLHCEKYINAAQQLAREADEMAKFHEMRAREMDGK
jgi:hypothetical protein